MLLVNGQTRAMEKKQDAQKHTQGREEMVPPQERRRRQVFCGKDDPGGRGREVILPDHPHPPKQVRDEGCRPWAQTWRCQRYAWKQGLRAYQGLKESQLRPHRQDRRGVREKSRMQTMWFPCLVSLPAQRMSSYVPFF